MKRIPIRPLCGTIILCKSKKEYKKEHKRRFGTDIDLEHKRGRIDGDSGTGEYLVWAEGYPQLAHEFCHVLLFVFELCGINPSDSQGEVFAYHMSQLLIDAGEYSFAGSQRK